MVGYYRCMVYSWRNGSTYRQHNSLLFQHSCFLEVKVIVLVVHQRLYFMSIAINPGPAIKKKQIKAYPGSHSKSKKVYSEQNVSLDGG